MAWRAVLHGELTWRNIKGVRATSIGSGLKSLKNEAFSLWNTTFLYRLSQAWIDFNICLMFARYKSKV